MNRNERMRLSAAYKFLQTRFRPIARIEVIELDSGCNEGEDEARPGTGLW